MFHNQVEKLNSVKLTMFGKSVPAILQLFILVVGFSPAYAGMIDMLTATVLGADNDSSHDIHASGPPDQVPPVNPPLDTPAFYNGLMNTPSTMPPSVPSDTLPGSSFGRAVVPVPASVWLLGCGLLGLICIARRKKSD
jgi:hypothetical protein